MSPSNFKVATINILFDLSLWDKRRGLLVKGLAGQEPDLVALQEVSLPQNNAAWLAKELGIPYVYLTPKTGKAAHREGIAILSRFPFEKQETLDLRTQQRVAQYVQVRVGGQPLVFANAHFYWQPGEAAERLQQVELMLEWLGAIPGSPGMVVCGDFNATPNLPSYRRMRQEFVSAYAAVHGQEPEFTSPTPLPRSTLVTLGVLLRFFKNIRLKEIQRDWHGTLDYIFTNQGVQVQDCQVVLNQPAPDDPRLYPSDHFGLAANLGLTTANPKEPDSRSHKEIP